MNLRVLQMPDGKTRLQFWNTPDGCAPHWKDVPVVKHVPQQCDGCGGTGGDWDARCYMCNGSGAIKR